MWGQGIAQWLRGFAVHAEDTNVVSSTHIDQLTTTCNFGSEWIQHFWPLWAPSLMRLPTYSYTTIKNNFKF